MKILLLLGVFIMSACSDDSETPTPLKKYHEIITHNHKRVDNYYWMRLTDEQKLSKKPFCIMQID